MPAPGAQAARPSAADSARFVLVGTSHAGNLGAAARAMKGMGCGDLWLLQPRFAGVLSREATVANFALQIESLARLPDEMKPDVFVAVADGINPEEMAKAANLFFHGPAGRERSDVGRLSGRGLHVHMARGALAPLLAASDIVLSQAGTATIQALGVGRPVLTFTRENDRMKRFIEENRLFGEARRMLPAEPEKISEAVRRLLAEPAEVERLGAIGKERIGGPGVIKEIIGVLNEKDTQSATSAGSSP